MKRLAGGLVAGLGATVLMEYASQWMYERQSEASREREERLRQEMPTTVLVRKVARAAGRQLGDEPAEKLGMATHYAFGAGGGPVAVALTSAGMAPLRAGLAVGAAMETVADQALNTALGLTPPPQAFPAVTHLRAVGAHVAYGLALGLMLEAGRQ